jgi:carbon monoxide dehydrogenase subunit G
MGVIEKSALVSAPPARVFEYLDDPARIPEYAPGVTQIDVTKRTDERVGDSYKTVYKVMGISFPSTFTTVEYARPEKVVARIEGAQFGTFDWRLKPEGDATRVTVRIDYQMKGGVIGKAMDALVVERMNERNAEQMLQNLKHLAEAEDAGKK